jgi:hypothetical protein
LKPIFSKSQVNFDAMSDAELKRYFLSNRQDQAAFQAYLDRFSQRPKSLIASPRDPNFDGSSGYLVISQAYVMSGKGFSPYGENKVYPEIQFQPQTQKNHFDAKIQTAIRQNLEASRSSQPANNAVERTE